MGTPTLTSALARTPRRIRVLSFGGVVSFDVPSTWTIARADGAGTAIAVVAAWKPDAGTTGYELALSDDLIPGVGYLVTAAGADGSPAAVWQPPLAQPIGRVPLDDPEAEAFGVDWDWLAGSLDASGDLPLVRGLPCLRHDLVAIAMTMPGELFHRPTEGGGLPARVNGPSALGAIAAPVRAAWRNDDRVKAASATVTAGTDGTVTVDGEVQTAALPDAIPVTTRGG